MMSSRFINDFPQLFLSTSLYFIGTNERYIGIVANRLSLKLDSRTKFSYVKLSTIKSLSCTITNGLVKIFPTMTKSTKKWLREIYSLQSPKLYFQGKKPLTLRPLFHSAEPGYVSAGTKEAGLLKTSYFHLG